MMEFTDEQLEQLKNLVTDVVRAELKHVVAGVAAMMESSGGNHEVSELADDDIEPTMTVDNQGTKTWRNADGQLHRTDGPAIEYANGDKEWWVNGKCHRTDGPAVVWRAYSGVERWYVNGKNLSEAEFNARFKVKKVGDDENSVSCVDDDCESAMTVNELGTKEWHNAKGQLHRLDGPALVHSDDNGTLEQWFKNGELHRLDGPARECDDGTKEWWVDGQLHREDGPAAEWPNGTRRWCVHGERHRTDGPAEEWAHGLKKWFVNDKLHRVDGPAVEWADGRREWWVDGKKLTETEFNARFGVKNNKDDETSDDSKSTMTVNNYGDKGWYNSDGQPHRTDGPALEFVNGSKIWYFDGELHRVDGPAIELFDGYKEWWVDGERHRTDGPAMESVDGGKRWFVAGEELTEDEFNHRFNK